MAPPIIGAIQAIELRLQRQSALATALNHSVQTQAYLVAYSDPFFVIGAALFLSGTSLFFLPKSHAMQGGT